MKELLHRFWFRVIRRESAFDYRMRLFRDQCVAIAKRDVPNYKGRIPSVPKLPH